MVNLGRPSKLAKYPPNVIRNQKYNVFSFIPLVLFEQFSVFLNLIFLIMACSQFIEALRVGYLYTYWAPLGFVLCVALIREAVDDIRRWRRDREVNNALYTKLMSSGKTLIPSSKIQASHVLINFAAQVGDLILLEKNQRISADMILLWTSEPNGACFIRTDQLDGETDWKLRNAVPVTQHLVAASGNPQSLFDIQAQIYAEAPSNHIHSFEGTFARTDVAPGSSAAAVGAETESSLSVDQTLWSGTVLATGTAVGIVIYTGCETRAVMNSSKAHTKMGRIDREINNITKLLFVVVVLLALVMVALQSFMGAWYINYWRFFLLFSYIIPLAYHQATMSVADRAAKVQAAVATLEVDLELLCLTGVEDRLQDGVRPALETLRNAGIKVWMLTGDKLETAECIAKSSRLVPHGQPLHIFQPVTGRSEAHLELNAFRRRCHLPLVITGTSLDTCLRYYEHETVELARQCPVVVVCRCSPTQKAGIAKLLASHTGAVIAAIGDGGNDVSMIQAAHVGIGIVGKEGRQASLASDFSITTFSHVTRLLLVHGRNCYKNTASLSQFIIHRGVIISVMQAIFSAIFYFVSVALFPGFLMVGYATIFTMFPVFSLVLDKDVSDLTALTYPELYKDLTKGRELTFKTFFIWMLISIYQGSVIMYGALILFDADFIHVVSITFTSVLLTELLMVALTIRTWHFVMIVSELASLAIYIVALVIFKSFFDQAFLMTWNFVWKVFAITAVSCIPLVVLKCIRLKLRPPIYSKLR
nr:unnamed protein product [Spirometra erinaceieuropaei]